MTPVATSWDFIKYIYEEVRNKDANRVEWAKEDLTRLKKAGWRLVAKGRRDA